MSLCRYAMYIHVPSDQYKAMACRLVKDSSICQKELLPVASGLLQWFCGSLGRHQWWVSTTIGYEADGRHAGGGTDVDDAWRYRWEPKKGKHTEVVHGPAYSLSFLLEV